MLIKTQIDISRGLQLTDLLLKKIPYSTNNALTRTANELVDVERDELKSEFKIRKQFVLNRVRITKFSRVNDLWTRVAIDSNVQGGKLLLAMFEEGGEKLPELGSELAVPITGGAARPSFSQKVTPSLLYKSLHMRKNVTSAGKIQYKGDRRTFIIAGVGIFERVTNRKREALNKKGIATKGHDTNVILLYKFKHGVPLRAQMHFVRTARELVQKRFNVIWNEELARELAGSARLRRR
jgi:hypothetical protein